MDSAEWLGEFYSTIKEDARMTVTHISLYVAIRYAWDSACCKVNMEVDRGNIMELAKISSPVTYRKTMHALHDFGYIQYSPFCGRRKSVVRLRKL
ncbi:MAG: hypothetical protein V4539_10360 [Bacteroidota bacterium]